MNTKAHLGRKGSLDVLHLEGSRFGLRGREKMEDESLSRKLIVRFDNHEEEATLFESAFAFDKKREIMRPHLPVVVAGSVRWVKMLLKRISGPITS